MKYRGLICRGPICLEPSMGSTPQCTLLSMESESTLEPSQCPALPIPRTSPPLFMVS